MTDVAWRQIRAFRDLAVHKYFSADWDWMARTTVRSAKELHCRGRALALRSEPDEVLPAQ
jgi:uncharacterized protein with HEPN domain